MANILIVEDDQDIAELLATNMAQENHQVTIANSGADGLKRIIDTSFDLIILDVMMPGMSGIEVCRQLRRTKNTLRTPVILLTALSSEADRISGFEAGADDYVVKPFSVRELMLRIRIKLQSEQKESREITRYHVGPLVIDTERLCLYAGDKEVALSMKEFKILTCLVESAGCVISRDSLLDYAWGNDTEIDYRTIDSYMTRLRVKLGSYGGMLQTIRGFGYKLEPVVGL